MRRYPPVSAVSLSTAVIVLFLLQLFPTDAVAAPQKERQLRREIVVVGPQPAHRRIVLEQLTDRGYLGVHLLNLTPELRVHFGAPATSGVLVSRVLPNSPAAAAGVAVGDVIVAADGEALAATSQLVGRMSSRREGDQIELGIVRERTRLELRATLAQSERRQIDVGQFVWHGGEDGAHRLELDPQDVAGTVPVDPQLLERVISIDPETINESVSRLLERLDAQGGVPGRSALEVEKRQQLEKRISLLEERLREMERRLQRRQRE